MVKRLFKRQEAIHTVEYENTYSMLSEITCGVPHGSTLGPKLFTLNVNDICNVSDILEFVNTVFADDTSIYYSHHDLSALYKGDTCGCLSFTSGF